MVRSLAARRSKSSASLRRSRAVTWLNWYALPSGYAVGLWTVSSMGWPEAIRPAASDRRPAARSSSCLARTVGIMSDWRLPKDGPACLAVPIPHTEDASQAGVEQRQVRSEEHTSELQSLMRISYAVFCLKKKKE